MSRLPSRICLLALCCSLLFCVAKIQAAPRSEDLLPDTTKGYISVGDVGALRDAFNRSQWGQLLNDPVLQPFVEDFRRQLREKGIQRLENLGLAWEELAEVPGGEASVAMIQPGPGRMAVVVVVDVTGHEAQAQALLKKIDARLAARGAERLPGDTTVVFQLPRPEGAQHDLQVAYSLSDNLLVASDDLEVLQAIEAARKSPRKDSLASLKSYHDIMARCQESAGATAPHLRWFVEPFGYVEMLRSTSTHEKRHGLDIYKILKNQGFTCIQGLGGFLNFSADGCELIHRTMVYAPPVKGHEQSKEKYELAARMLCFPPAADLEPQPWVPARIATYNTFNLDIQTAFAASETLVDEVMAEKGVFHDVLDSLKNDPQGPKVDIVKDLIGNLKSRVTIITDYQLPIGPKSERLLAAVETNNEAVVAETVARTMKGDARRREFEGHMIWEVTDEENDVPDIKIESPDGGVQHADKEADAADAKRSKDDKLMPNAAVCVAYGHVFVASHIDFLQQILHQAAEHGSTLAQCSDYRLVAEQTKRLSTGEPSVRLFSRTDEAYRPTYELVRTAQMPKAETLLGQALNAVLGDGKDGVPRQQKIDGRLLPPFDEVAHYFGPAGTTVTSEPSGWFVVGMTLNKSLATDKPAPELARQPAAPAKTPVHEASQPKPTPKAVESTATEPKNVEVKSADAKPAPVNTDSAKAVEAKAVDSKPSEVKAADAKPTDAKPLQVKAVETNILRPKHPRAGSAPASAPTDPAAVAPVPPASPAAPATDDSAAPVTGQKPSETATK